MSEDWLGFGLFVFFIVYWVGSSIVIDFLAIKISKRFRDIGYEMKSKSYAIVTCQSPIYTSPFWREAKEVNAKYCDQIISKYLSRYNLFINTITIFMLFVSFAMIAFFVIGV